MDEQGARQDRLAERIERLGDRLDRAVSRLERRIDRSVDDTYQQIEALIALYREIDERPALPPLRRWAISPDTARQIRSLIEERSPQLTVELGSGSSTVLLAMLLERFGGGRLVSIEHDAVYFAATSRLLSDTGLDGVVDLRLAPLEPVEIGGTQYDWYDVVAFEGLEEIDMVIVDGPPEAIGPESRFPAVPMLAPRCAPAAAFVLDDYRRQNEQHVVERWTGEFGATLIRSIDSVEKGMAVVELGSRDA